MTPFQEAVDAVLRTLEPGQVVTYGEVAAEAGHPGAARAVGTFLRDHHDNPWWRVVRSDGRLLEGREAEQICRLAAEGITAEAGTRLRAAARPPRRARPARPAAPR